MTLRATFALSALYFGLSVGLNADDSKPVLQLDFGQEESAPLIAVGNVVRDQAGPLPPEFPDFETNNTAILARPATIPRARATETEQKAISCYEVRQA